LKQKPIEKSLVLDVAAALEAAEKLANDCHSERSEESLQSFAGYGTQKTTAEILRFAQNDSEWVWNGGTD
jgi:hypothetical protein